MPYVPCPWNSSVSQSATYTSSFTTYKDGVVIGKGDVKSRPALVKGAVKQGEKGRKITIRGGPWSPCRTYKRGATTVVVNPGSSFYVSTDKRSTRVWSGYPHSGGVFDYNQNLPSYVEMTANVGCSLDSQFVPSFGTNMLNRMKTELLLKAGRRQVNYGEAIAEGKSTLRMLVQAATTVARAYKAARQGRFFAVAKILRKPRLKFPKGTPTARKWLAYQYGWQPFMNDVYDSYKLLQKGLDLRPQVLSVTRQIREQDSRQWSRSNWKSVYYRTECRYSGKMFYRIADNWLSGMQQLGLINPAEVAWAVVPFSFVVDWFLPVGNYLEALSARVGLTFVDGYYGIKVETTSFNSGPTVSQAGFQLVSSSGDVTRYTSGYRRTRMTSLPWPGLYIKSPFSLTHVTSAIALLKTLRR